MPHHILVIIPSNNVEDHSYVASKYPSEIRKAWWAKETYAMLALKVYLFFSPFQKHIMVLRWQNPIFNWDAMAWCLQFQQRRNNLKKWICQLNRFGCSSEARCAALPPAHSGVFTSESEYLTISLEGQRIKPLCFFKCQIVIVKTNKHSKDTHHDLPVQVRPSA